MTNMKSGKGNDVVYTPTKLAEDIVKYFNPTGRVLEPCRGDGAFYNTGLFTDWCEIAEGKDFYEFNDSVDWIITNPPWSQITKFIEHSIKHSDNVVFLTGIYHMMTKKRLRLMKEAGLYLTEVILVDTPPNPWPQMGLQVGVTHWSKQPADTVKWTLCVGKSK